MNCDRLAPWYRWLEYGGFGRALERRRFRYLGELNNPQRVLMLGEGDGRFLARFVQHFPTARVDYVDSSSKMLALAAGRAKGGFITFHHLNAIRDELPGTGYDLVVAHFFLDCFTDADASALIHKFAAAAAPQAQWLISEFDAPEKGWRRWYALGYVRLLYGFFRVVTGLQTRRLPAYRGPLYSLGFRIAQREEAWLGLLVSELWSR